MEGLDIIYKNRLTNKEVGREIMPGDNVYKYTDAKNTAELVANNFDRPQVSATNPNAQGGQPAASQNVDYQDMSQSTTSLAVVKNVAFSFTGEFAVSKLALFVKGMFAAKTGVEVSQASIAKALEGSTMKTIQGEVSLPVVQRYVNMLESGSVSPSIKVADGVIIDGNHRYIAGRLFGVEPFIVPGTLPSSQASRIVPIQQTKINLLDWGGH